LNVRESATLEAINSVEAANAHPIGPLG